MSTTTTTTTVTPPAAPAPAPNLYPSISIEAQNMAIADMHRAGSTVHLVSKGSTYDYYSDALYPRNTWGVAAGTPFPMVKSIAADRAGYLSLYFSTKEPILSASPIDVTLLGQFYKDYPKFLKHMISTTWGLPDIGSY